MMVYWGASNFCERSGDVKEAIIIGMLTGQIDGGKGYYIVCCVGR